ncbi:MAG: hypothetical protein ACLGIN_00955 [Candidatus Sericytochromatia bacterium]
MPRPHLRLFLLLALAATPLTGCVIHAPAGPAATAYRSSWIEQVKLKIEPAATGPRVASAAPSSWHRVRVTVGRLDGAMPAATKTLDPFEDELGGQVLGSLQPGPGYWVQVDLVHLSGGGAEWVVGSGRLGGGGQSVLLHAGPNAVPIAVKPLVAGGRLDASPTPTTRRKTRVRSGGVVIIDGGVFDESAPPSESPAVVEDEEDLSLDWLFEEWDSADEEDWESSDEEDEEDDEALEDLGDWLGGFSALEAPASPLAR